MAMQNTYSASVSPSNSNAPPSFLTSTARQNTFQHSSPYPPDSTLPMSNRIPKAGIVGIISILLFLPLTEQLLIPIADLLSSLRHSILVSLSYQESRWYHQLLCVTLY